MPLYEYRCEECGVRFERRQSFNADPIAECPECGGHVHRVIGTTGVIFKGSGFYVTDNRKSNNSAGIPTSKNNTDSGESKTETKSESKTETKPDSKAGKAGAKNEKS